MTWKKVPDDRRFRARLIDGTTKEYTELRIGDVFQAIDPSGVCSTRGLGSPMTKSMPVSSVSLRRISRIWRATPFPFWWALSMSFER